MQILELPTDNAPKAQQTKQAGMRLTAAFILDTQGHATERMRREGAEKINGFIEKPGTEWAAQTDKGKPREKPLRKLQRNPVTAVNSPRLYGQHNLGLFSLTGGLS